MARVAFNMAYTGETTDDKTGNVDEAQHAFLQACRDAGVTTVDRHSPVSAYADGESLVRLITKLNDAHVPYAVEEQSQRAEDDGMPA